MKIGAIIQARTSSKRLPKKVLKELPYGSRITILEQVIRRVKKSNKLDEIIIATTRDKEDEEIINIAEKEAVQWYLGSKENVLERYYLTSKKNNIDIVVRITSDCPCIDPEVVDLVIEKHLKSNADYTSNALERSFPHGLDTEVLNFNTLETAYYEAKSDFEKEHVSPYIYKTNPHKFKIFVVKAPENIYAPDIRITIDTEEDYALLCTVFDYLYKKNEFFTTKEIINLFNKKPWLKLINKQIQQKKTFESFEDELKETIKI